MLSDQPPERRLLAYRISDEDILFFLRRFDNWPECLSVTTNLKGPPRGCRIEYISPSLSSRCMWAVVYHPEFEIVPDGEMIPRANDPLSFERSVLRRGEDGAYRIS